MSGEWIFFPSFFGTVSFVVWVVVSNWQRRQHVKLLMEFNNRVLERLGSTKDFSDFLQSDGGDRLMRALAAERGATGPRDRILTAVQSGVVFVAVGIGLLVVAMRTIGGEHAALTLISAIILSLGLGLILSSVASYWVARTLGVFEAEGSLRTDRTAAP
jgi:hypothetical protein